MPFYILFFFSLQKFEAHIFSGPQSEGLNKGNVRLAYDSVSDRLDVPNCIPMKIGFFYQLIEKAEAREKERLKAEERKVNTTVISNFRKYGELFNKLSAKEACLCSLCSNEGRKHHSSPCSRPPTLHCSLQTLGKRYWYNFQLVIT